MWKSTVSLFQEALFLNLFEIHTWAKKKCSSYSCFFSGRCRGNIWICFANERRYLAILAPLVLESLFPSFSSWQFWIPRVDGCMIYYLLFGQQYFFFPPNEWEEKNKYRMVNLNVKTSYLENKHQSGGKKVNKSTVWLFFGILLILSNLFLATLLKCWF